MAFYDTMLLPLRGVQIVFLIIVLGTSAQVVSSTNDFFGDASSQFAYLLFASVWTALALVYLMVAPRFVPAVAHRFALMAVEALTMLFWFTAWIACAARLGDNTPFTDLPYGATAKAATAFGALEWLLFVASLVFVVLSSRGGGSGGAAAAKGPTPYGSA